MSEIIGGLMTGIIAASIAAGIGYAMFCTPRHLLILVRILAAVVGFALIIGVFVAADYTLGGR